MSARPRRSWWPGSATPGCSDDGFGGEVAGGWSSASCPTGVSVMDFGTGGLDLAYEVMRGYHALVLVDVSKQGEAPGTLYVMEPVRGGGRAAIEDGEVIDPHAMDPADRAAVRQGGRRLAGQGRTWWPASRLTVEEMGLGLSDEVAAAVDARGRAGAQTVEELRCTSSH